jgi:predicted oxidoreductase
MWHYTEGVENWAPIWRNHGIRILPGPSSLWLDATGRRLPAPLFPGFDTLGTLAHIMSAGYDHSWFVLNQAIIAKEFALSGSEQNPDLTGKNIGLLAPRLFARAEAPAPVEAFKSRGTDFIVEDRLSNLVWRMNALTGMDLLSEQGFEREVRSRDQAWGDPIEMDPQVAAVRAARRYVGDRVSRVTKPRRLLDVLDGPLIAVRLRILTRKTLGGLHTDLQARALDGDGNPVPGLFAAGEVAGFGGGGMHGYRALEGTFLGGCLFSGRVAGRAAAWA